FYHKITIQHYVNFILKKFSYYDNTLCASLREWREDKEDLGCFIAPKAGSGLYLRPSVWPCAKPLVSSSPTVAPYPLSPSAVVLSVAPCDYATVARNTCACVDESSRCGPLHSIAFRPVGSSSTTL